MSEDNSSGHLRVIDHVGIRCNLIYNLSDTVDDREIVVSLLWICGIVFEHSPLASLLSIRRSTDQIQCPKSGVMIETLYMC